MKVLLMVVGVLALAMGLLWMGQGAGVIRWPASSFMIAQTPWLWRGSTLAILGVLAILWSRRRV